MDELKQRIINQLMGLESIDIIALENNIDKRTIYRWYRDDPAFKESLQENIMSNKILFSSMVQATFGKSIEKLSDMMQDETVNSNVKANICKYLIDLTFSRIDKGTLSMEETHSDNSAITTNDFNKAFDKIKNDFY